MKYLLFIALLLVGCGEDGAKGKDGINGKDGFPAHYGSFDPGLHPYIHVYDTHAKARGKTDSKVMNSVTLTDEILVQQENVAGVCYIYNNGYKEIKIRTKYWFNYTEAQKSVLMAHELGHCTMGYAHRSGTFFSRGYKINSIMYPSVLNAAMASNFWSALINELFSQKAPFNLTNSDDCKRINPSLVACIVKR